VPQSLLASGGVSTLVRGKGGTIDDMREGGLVAVRSFSSKTQGIQAQVLDSGWDR
jgi:hypothetical protein